ncbi:MAG: iron-containing alcohol dehydrogenase [Spirochaetales bacterium]|nr:iron-containing alcohol dehydrogenase [Spirochaetales bacterium]
MADKMSDILINIQPKIFFGVDSLAQVGLLIPDLGKRILIVTEAILYENKTIERLKEFLSQKGIDHIIFDEVVPNATSSTIDDGIKIARVSKAEAIIGMGGVRTCSTAKAIAMAARTKSYMDEFLSGFQADKPALPYIEIPTSFRNPFMLSDEYLAVDARNRAGKIAETQPDITKMVFVDPKLTMSLPPKYAVTILLDILLHAIEGYISNRSNFLTDIYLTNAIERVFKAIPLITESPDELNPRIMAVEAGLLMAFGLNSSKAGIGAALSYAINAKKMVPKSWIAALLLPHIIEFNAHVRPKKLAQVARIFGENEPDLPDEVLVQKAIETLRNLIGKHSLPARLSEFDLVLDDMIEVAETAYNYNLMKFLPRGVSINEIYEMIKAAF